MELVALRGSNRHEQSDILSVFRCALEEGATAIDVGVRRSQDGVLVVCKEAVWKGRRISKTRYEMIKKGLLRFEDLLQALPRTRFVVWILDKDFRLVDEIIRMIERLKAVHRVCLASHSLEVQLWIEDFGYAGQRTLSRLEFWALLLLPEKILRRFHWQGRRCTWPVRWVNPFWINKCHRLGLIIGCAEVNNLAIAKRINRLGIDYIVTGNPAAIFPICGVTI